MANEKVINDPRIDPRLKAFLGAMDLGSAGDVASREELVAQANSPQAVAARQAIEAMFEAADTDELAPKGGPVHRAA